jgi:uncharacterized protein YndB with AHSA1/START domain
MATGEVAAAFPDLTRYGVMKHLRVLTEAGLVVSRKEGRKRWNYLNAVPLRQIYERWVSRYEDLWAGSLLSLKRVVEGRRAMGVTEQGPARVVRIEEEVVIAAAPAKVFAALTEDVGLWFWRGPKGTDPEAVLEAQAGGRFYREWGEGNTELYGVVGLIKRDRQLRLIGSIGVAHAISSVADFVLEEDGEATRVRLTHRISGEVVDAEVADFAEGWRDELASLKRFVETGVGRAEAPTAT